MNEHLEANRKSWGAIDREHYRTFKTVLAERESTFHKAEAQELGGLDGKSLVHLQCNIGVDFTPENIHYARKLAADSGIPDARFIEANILEIMDRHDEKHDIVYSTDGVLCWLPDLALWAVNYGWMYTAGEIITSLSKAGMHIEWFHEFDWLYYKLSVEKQERDADGNWCFPEHRSKLPFTYSLKATAR